MKKQLFDEVFPSATPDIGRAWTVRYDGELMTVVKGENAKPCWHCGAMTNWFELDFQAHFCSPQCLKAKMREYSAAVSNHVTVDAVINNMQIDPERFTTALRVAKHMIEDWEKRLKKAIAAERWEAAASISSYTDGMKQILVVFDNVELVKQPEPDMLDVIKPEGRQTDRESSRNSGQAEQTGR